MQHFAFCCCDVAAVEIDTGLTASTATVCAFGQHFQRARRAETRVKLYPSILREFRFCLFQPCHLSAHSRAFALLCVQLRRVSFHAFWQICQRRTWVPAPSATSIAFFLFEKLLGSKIIYACRSIGRSIAEITCASPCRCTICTCFLYIFGLVLCMK